MAHPCRFGEFKLLPDERLLFRRGVEVALTARAFDLLVAFVARPGQLVAKGELFRSVWGERVVEENNLAVQVGILRKLLGADAISTVPGFGYRFTLEVIDVGIDAPPEPSPPFRGNLPRRLPSLIGREVDLAESAALLDKHPLLTICGGPGLGKTRLAQELASRAAAAFVDGGWWIDLTLLRDGESIASAVARVLGVTIAEGEAPLGALTRRLAGTTMLLVLDNAEHRLADVAEVAVALVRDTTHTRLIVTSQAPLRTVDERLLRLSPLALHDAACLLAQRAGLAEWPGDVGTQIEHICRGLDGNPLAIELAAARVEALGLDGLAARLQQRLTLLAPVEPARPTRLNALVTALDWSYDLLAPRERRVLRSLAVFPGSFSLEGAALALAGDGLPAARVVEAVLNLVERSLLSVDLDRQRRFRLLETTRLFALDRLHAEGETRVAWSGFGQGLRQLFEDAYEESWRARPHEWRQRHEPELAALWSALNWATSHDVECAAGLFGASWPLWVRLPVSSVARTLAGTLAEDVTDAVAAPVRARFWLACANCWTMTHPGRARDAAERAAGLYRDLGDARGEYLALVEYAFNWRVDAVEARAALKRARLILNPAWSAAIIERGLTSEAVLHMTAGRHDAARRCYVEARAVCERDAFESGVTRAIMNLADLERAAGHVDEAVRIGEALCERVRDQGESENLCTLLMNLLGALGEQGHYDKARAVALECKRRIGRLMLDDCGWIALDTLARLHLHDGKLAAAARLAGAADREFAAHGQPQRQPNEAADRAALDAGLRARLPQAEIDRLHAEGRRMSTTESVTLAFAVEPTPTPAHADDQAGYPVG